jgi:hypothetical protein
MHPVNRRIFLILIIQIIWLPLNCGSSQNEKKLDEKKPSVVGPVTILNPYFPLSTGNEWEYVNEEPGEELKTYKTGISTKWENSIEIFELSSFPFFSREEKTARFVIKDGAVYLTDTASNNRLLIPRPADLSKGHVWEFGEWRATIASTKESVKTEYGTFENCIYLNYSIYFTFSAELWLAQNAGIVKWGYNRTNPPTLKPEYYVLSKMKIAG